MRFKKNQAKVQVLLDFNNKFNAITAIYAVKLGFKI